MVRYLCLEKNSVSPVCASSWCAAFSPRHTCTRRPEFLDLSFSPIEPAPVLSAWQHHRIYDFTPWVILLLVVGATFTQRHSSHPSLAMKWVPQKAPSSIQHHNNFTGRIVTAASLCGSTNTEWLSASHREGDASFQWLLCSLSFLSRSHLLIITSINFLLCCASPTEVVHACPCELKQLPI